MPDRRGPNGPWQFHLDFPDLTLAQRKQRASPRSYQVFPAATPSDTNAIPSLAIAVPSAPTAAYTVPRAPLAAPVSARPLLRSCLSKRPVTSPQVCQPLPDPLRLCPVPVGAGTTGVAQAHTQWCSPVHRFPWQGLYFFGPRIQLCGLSSCHTTSLVVLAIFLHYWFSLM